MRFFPAGSGRAGLVKKVLPRASRRCAWVTSLDSRAPEDWMGNSLRTRLAAKDFADPKKSPSKSGSRMSSRMRSGLAPCGAWLKAWDNTVVRLQKFRNAD